MKTNRPLIDTGWRVGMPAFQNHNQRTPLTKTVVVTGIDGKNYPIKLQGYGRPEWGTVDR